MILARARVSGVLPLLGLALVLGLPLGEAALAVPGIEAGLLFLAPLGLLLAVLALGRYPGERALRAAARWWADRRRVRPAAQRVPLARRRPVLPLALRPVLATARGRRGPPLTACA